jgi:AcrR family transcriptional regulator
MAAMGIKERRVRHKEQLRQEILDTARELFVQEGYENVSMRKIAQRIEYSPTTIYHHFENKADLLYSLVQETFSRLLATLGKIDEAYHDPLDRLRESGRAFVKFGLSYPNHYRVAFMMPIDPKDEQEKARYLSPTAMGQMTFTYLRTLVDACVKQGKFRQVDVEATAQALFAVVHGVTSILIVYPEFPWVDRDQLIDHVIDSALRGFQTR